jgi:hypothetical protein
LGHELIVRDVACVFTASQHLSHPALTEPMFVENDTKSRLDRQPYRESTAICFSSAVALGGGKI